MKFTCEKYLLSLAVATAGRAAASKSPIPAMEGLLIEAGHNVRVTGYDLKKGIYTTFEADVSASYLMPNSSATSCASCRTASSRSARTRITP